MTSIKDLENEIEKEIENLKKKQLKILNESNNIIEEKNIQIMEIKSSLYDEIESIYKDKGLDFSEEDFKDVLKLVKDNIKNVESNEVILYYKRKHKNLNYPIEATCLITDEGKYKVLKGSKKNPKGEPYLTENIKKKRLSAKIDRENNILLEDILFSSPSAAGCFVSGKSINGFIDWRLKDGRSLSEYIKEND